MNLQLHHPQYDERTSYFLLSSDEEFSALVPLVARFSLKTKTPLWKNLLEVSSTFTSSEVVTTLGRVEGKLVAYFCGYLLSATEFYVSQALSEVPSCSAGTYKLLEARARVLGATKILGLTESNPRAFKKYGFTLERYLLSKPL